MVIKRREEGYSIECERSFHGRDNPRISKTSGRKRFLALKTEQDEKCLLRSRGQKNSSHETL
jgi:hypothetical protein